MLTEKKDEKGIIVDKKDDLWFRITALAEKEDISYLEAVEKCIMGYWKDKGLSKEM